MTGARLRREGSGPVAMWAAMRRLDRRPGGWTIDQVAARVPDVTRNTVACYVSACRRAGHVEIVGERPVARTGSREKLYSVNLNSSAAPFEKDRLVRGAVRPGTVQLQLWTAMRRLSSWTSQELALAASTDDVAVSVPVARKYAAALRSTSFSCSNKRIRFFVSRNSLRSASVKPGRVPSSISAFFNQL